MKIKDVKTFAVGNPPPHHGGPSWVFVKLITDNGIEGIGEVFGVPFHPNVVTRMTEDVAARHVIGVSPFKIETLWRTSYSSGYNQHPDMSVLGVLSGIEMACWDILGKALEQPVYNLLGGQVHEQLRSYTYLYAATADPTADPAELRALASVHSDPEQAAARALHYLELGFTAVKFDPIMPMSVFDPRQLSLEALDKAEAVIKAMREAVGSRCDLLFGTHGQMTTSAAIRLARRLEPYQPLWFEEPVPPENVEEMAAVARATSIPVATGEPRLPPHRVRRRARATIQPALGRVGGILEAKKIAGMAEAHYVQIAPHLYCGPIEAAANIQLATCSPNFLIQESIETFGGFHAEILKSPIQWENGYIIPPTAPGLGVELDEAVAAAHPYTGAEVFPVLADRPL